MPEFKLLPHPPAPSGIDQWPPPPGEQLCWQDSLPDVTAVVGYIGLTKQTMTVYGQYTQLLQATVTPETSPLTRKISVTRGTETTLSESTAISLSFGMELPGIGKLGSKIDQTIGYSQTWSQSTTTEDQFTITAARGKKVSAIFWQAKYRYVFKATPVLLSDNMDNSPEQFRELMKAFFKALIEKGELSYPKEIILACDTFSSSQYPPDTSVSLAIRRPTHFAISA
jgi:hypothetical protein